MSDCLDIITDATKYIDYLKVDIYSDSYFVKDGGSYGWRDRY